MSRRTPSKSGYTFTEILIVIAIIGILVALLLPAVQAAREAARRMSCGKNLEQLILAVQNYEMLHRVYPPGTINATGPIQSLPQGYHHNWSIQLLPYLEQKNTHAHIDSLVGVYHRNNNPVRQLNITTLNCPSAPHAPRGYTDYAGVHNDIEAPIDVTNNGVFYLNSSTSYFDLKDGSSHTIFIGEKETYSGDLGWMSGTRATLRNTGILINASKSRTTRGTRPYSVRPFGYPPGVDSDKFPTEILPDGEDILRALFGEGADRRKNLSVWNAFDERGVIPEESRYDELGMYEYEPMGGMGGGMMSGPGEYEEFVAKQEAAKARTVANFTENPALAVGGFGSQHPGGAQFALGDGSVQFFAATVDSIVFLQLGNRDDGRLIVEN